MTITEAENVTNHTHHGMRLGVCGTKREKEVVVREEEEDAEGEGEGNGR